jgi:hypothetical protein
MLALPGDAAQIADEARGFCGVSAHVTSPDLALVMELTHEPPGLSAVLSRAIAALERP